MKIQNELILVPENTLKEVIEHFQDEDLSIKDSMLLDTLTTIEYQHYNPVKKKKLKTLRPSDFALLQKKLIKKEILKANILTLVQNFKDIIRQAIEQINEINKF